MTSEYCVEWALAGCHSEGADHLSDGAAIIDAGRIVAIDAPERLRSAMRSSQYVELSFRGAAPPEAALRSLPGVSQVGQVGGFLRLYGETPGRVATEVARLSEASGAEIDRLCTCTPSLEDVFLHFTGREEEPEV